MAFQWLSCDSLSLAGLLLGQEKNLSSAGIVKWWLKYFEHACYLFSCWGCNRLSVVGHESSPYWLPCSILVRLPFINFYTPHFINFAHADRAASCFLPEVIVFVSFSSQRVFEQEGNQVLAIWSLLISSALIFTSALPICGSSRISPNCLGCALLLWVSRAASPVWILLQPIAWENYFSVHQIQLTYIPLFTTTSPFVPLLFDISPWKVLLWRQTLPSISLFPDTEHSRICSIDSCGVKAWDS